MSETPEIGGAPPPTDIPHRKFVVLPTDLEMASPEGRAKMLVARKMVRSVFPDEVLTNVESQARVNATIDIMATALVSTGINYGEGDYPNNDVGKFFRADPADPDSVPHLYHNKTGTWDAIQGAKFVREWQQVRGQNLELDDQLILGLVSAGDDLVFSTERGQDERQSAETIAALMRKAGVFDPGMIEKVRACIAASVFSDRQGFVGNVEEEYHPPIPDANLQNTLDSLVSIHNAGADGDLIVLATRQGPQRGILHEMEGLWRLVETQDQRASVSARFVEYFRVEGIRPEEVTINDIIGFIDKNPDLRIALGRGLIMNSRFVRSHQYNDESLNTYLQDRKGVNADFGQALGEAILAKRMTVEQAYYAAVKYAGPKSFELIFTPEVDRADIVDGARMPRWQELVSSIRSS